MAENQAFWDDFYRSIYGTPDAEISPQAELAYGLTDKPAISGMARISSRRMLSSSPDRLAANVGTPAGPGLPRPQVYALGAGLSPNVNALGYRVVEQANPATMAIQAASPVQPARSPVSTQLGIARAPVPRWIASMLPKAMPVQAAPQLNPAQIYDAAAAQARANPDAASRVNGNDRNQGGGPQSLSGSSH